MSLLEVRGRPASSSICACSATNCAEFADLLQPVRRIRAHLVEFVDECLDVAVLALEMVGVGRLVRLRAAPDRRPFPPAWACLSSAWVSFISSILRLKVWRRVGRQHLVEDRQRHVVLGGQDLVPIADECFHALHQELAPVIGGEADRRAAECRGDDRTGLVAPRKGAALRCCSRCCGCCSRELVRFEVRLWVRVAIKSSLAGLPHSTVGGEARSDREARFATPFGALVRRRSTVRLLGCGGGATSFWRRRLRVPARAARSTPAAAR